MKSLLAHYRNKYPGGIVQASESALDVYDEAGNHAVAMRRSGSGAMVCVSEEFGCSHRHDLAPIPKDARLWKIVDGKIVKDDQFEARSKLVKQFVKDGKVLSCEELGGKQVFDESQKLRQGAQLPSLEKAQEKAAE